MFHESSLKLSVFYLNGLNQLGGLCFTMICVCLAAVSQYTHTGLHMAGAEACLPPCRLWVIWLDGNYLYLLSRHYGPSLCLSRPRIQKENVNIPSADRLI